MADRLTTYLYVISADLQDGGEGGLCKVGISNNPRGRLNNFKTACPYPLKIFELWDCETRQIAVAAERISHKKLREFHAHGEWFQIPPRGAVIAITQWMAEVSQRLTGECPQIPFGGFGELESLL